MTDAATISLAANADDAAPTALPDVLDDGALRRVREPIATARGLPARAYTSQAFFDLEQVKVFRGNWVGAAFAREIAAPGDAIPVEVGGVPLILARGNDGVVRAFHNVCRHRAALILRGPVRGQAVLRCPYHAWAWSLDGDLRAMPYFDGTPAAQEHLCAADRQALALAPVRVAEYGNWIFVNVDGTAPPAEDYLAGFARVAAGYDLAALALTHTVTWEFAANWKLMADNWETYHHVWVHEGFFDKMSEEIDPETGELFAKTEPDGNALVLRWPLDKANVGFPFDPGALPPLPRLPGAPPVGRSTSVIFPNVIATIAPHHVSTLILEPVAPDRTRMRMGFLFPKDVADDPRYAAGREAVLDRWLGKSRRKDGLDGIRSQDLHTFEGQQIARRSPAADDVRFSPFWEKNVWHFQNRLLEALR